MFRRTVNWLALLAVAAGTAGFDTAAPARAWPETLPQTGWVDGGDGLLTFEPTHSLWSDGASKRRWLALPPGANVDASDIDHWRFPRGTRLWKEFAVDGRPVETRIIERSADGRWSFASYIWPADGGPATLAPAAGAVLGVAGAPEGRYEVPSRQDCLACHDAAPVPVLGFSALQLGDRAAAWASQGVLAGLPAPAPPSERAAVAPVESAALGYLHANCGHCHHREGGGVPLRLSLRLRADPAHAAEALRAVRASVLDVPGRWRPPGAEVAVIVRAGDPAHSTLLQRMQSHQPAHRMPPLGTRRPDPDGIAQVDAWIRQLPASETPP